MINQQELKNLVTEWQLREDVIEKDYVIGWLLWGIGSEPELKDNWIFKGGTCLKKCFIETYRFSEDLDFTILPTNKNLEPDKILPIIEKLLKRVGDESGIDFSVEKPIVKQKSFPLYLEGRVYYRGPRQAKKAASIKLDLSSSEVVVCPSVLKTINHPYSDKIPTPSRVRCYSFEEVFAEKIRAMGERSRPRDLYDIINLYRHSDLKTKPKNVNTILTSKCTTKNVPIPSFLNIKNSSFFQELESEWANMLDHQLPKLPPFKDFWEELPKLFSWLNGTYIPSKLSTISFKKEEDKQWRPPATSWQWGMGIPLETIRFAGANHLCIKLGYIDFKNNFSERIIEPYSFRRTKDHNLLLYAIKVETQKLRSYRVDRIKSVEVISMSFIPKYRIEFST
ncbi:nucleotidyl transferase AbiEii/AbiGii toxin family protein [bacterium]|nr:nucleotidyl transferase AbiEii/AbiGii toxin family protein [bacterium]